MPPSSAATTPRKLPGRSSFSDELKRNGRSIYCSVHSFFIYAESRFSRGHPWLPLPGSCRVGLPTWLKGSLVLPPPPGEVVPGCPQPGTGRGVILSGGEAGAEGSRPRRKVCFSGCCNTSNSAPSGSFADAQDDKGGSLALDDVLRLLRRGDPCGRPPLASPRVGERCREATERGRPSTSQSRPSSPARPKPSPHAGEGAP